jgi:hypothetical protein
MAMSLRPVEESVERATVRERADYSQFLHGQAQQPLLEPGRRSSIDIHIHRRHFDYP